MPTPARVVAGIALAAAAVQALQVPLQKPVSSPEVDDVVYEPQYSKKSLVDSQTLQDLVDIKNLQRRAEKLYDIAKLSEEEYNHPTRVIGSRGEPVHAWTRRMRLY